MEQDFQIKQKKAIYEDDFKKFLDNTFQTWIAHKGQGDDGDSNWTKESFIDSGIDSSGSGTSDDTLTQTCSSASINDDAISRKLPFYDFTEEPATTSSSASGSLFGYLSYYLSTLTLTSPINYICKLIQRIDNYFFPQEVEVDDYEEDLVIIPYLSIATPFFEPNDRNTSRFHSKIRVAKFEPFQIQAQLIDDKSYEATFDFGIPPECLAKIQQVELTVTVEAKVNLNWQVPYYLFITWTVDGVTSGVHERSEPIHPSSLCCQYYGGVPSKVVFFFTEELKEIVLDEAFKMTTEIRGLRLSLCVRRRLLTNKPAKCIPLYDANATDKFSPTDLKIAWHPGSDNGGLKFHPNHL